MTGNPLAGRRLLIVEDDPNGHQLVYVRHLVEYASAAGATVIAVVTPNVRAAEQWRLNLEPLQERMKVHVVDTTDLAGLVQITTALAADHTIVGDGDHLAMRLGVVGRWRGTGTLTALAGLHGVRVVAAGAHSLARDVERLPVAAWTELDAPALATALQEMRASHLISEPLDLGTTQFCEALFRPLYERDQTTDDRRVHSAVCREHDDDKEDPT